MEQKYSIRKLKNGIGSKLIGLAITGAIVTSVGELSNTTVYADEINNPTSGQETKTPESVQSQIESHQNNVAKIEGKITELNQQESNIQSEISKTEKELLTVNNDNFLEDEYKETISETETQIENLSKEIQSKEDLVVQTNSEISTITENISLKQEIIQATENEIRAVQEQISSAKPVIKTETEEIAENTLADSYLNQHNGIIEEVVYDGEKTEIIKLTKEQYDNYVSTGNFDYVPNQTEVAKELRAIMLQLREINGITIPVPEITEETMRYSLARAKEMLQVSEGTNDSNQLGGHQTSLTKISGYENTGATTISESTGDWGVTRILSDKELAYFMAFSWFSEYTNRASNLSKNPYGHRYTLLFGNGTSMGVGYSSDSVAYHDTNFYSLNLGGLTVEKLQEYRTEVNKITFDGINMIYNGNQVKFIPKTVFKYVYETTVTTPANTRSLERKISTLNNTLSTQRKEVETLTIEKAQKEASLSTLELSISNLTSRKVAKEEILSTAKSALSNLEKGKAVQISNIETKLENLRTNLTRVQNERTELISQKETFTIQIKALEELKNQLSPKVKNYLADSRMYLGEERIVKNSDGTVTVYKGTKLKQSDVQTVQVYTQIKGETVNTGKAVVIIRYKVDSATGKYIVDEKKTTVTVSAYRGYTVTNRKWSYDSTSNSINISVRIV